MKKREGNDIRLVWTVLSNGVAEDFSLATNIEITAFQQFLSTEEIDVPFVREDNIFTITIPADVLEIGSYDLKLTYNKPATDIESGLGSYSVDSKDAFEVVRYTDDEDEAGAEIIVQVLELGEAIQLAQEAASLANEKALYADEQGDYAKAKGDEAKATNDAVVIAEGDADSGRVKAELDRVAAEEARVNAEGDATKGRVKAENDRVTAEQARVLAEAARNVYEAYDNGKPYVINNKVSLLGSSYVCISPCQGVTPPNATNWLVISSKGDTGQDAYAFYLEHTTDDPPLSEVEWAVYSKEQGDYAKEQGDYAKGVGDSYTGELALKEDTTDAIDRHFKTLNLGAAGLVTLSPTTSYGTYRLSVTGNVTLNIDLNRMIEQVGNARCRLIIDMPVLKTITITSPVLWGGTAPTFAAAGQYIIEVIDVDGTNVPLMWVVASTTKAQTTGVILYVDSTGADYSVAQINGEIADRTTSSWISPFKYLQNAINAAQAGDIIFVKQGVYKPTHLRTTPTVYVDGDRLNRNATFTPKNGVDIYGGFLGTETKTWQRVMDANGYPVNKTILCGDIAGEATVDPAKTVGDTRTDASKANAAYNVVFGKNISALTYLNGVNVRYGNASDATGDQSLGGGIYSAALLIGINNTAYSNTASYGGGWYSGFNTNCTAYSNTATANGGGWREGTNTNCIAYSNAATSNGGGWNLGTNTNCTAYGNRATSNAGGWYGGTNTNCTSYNNTATNGGGWHSDTNTNCTSYNNTATANGGGWYGGTNTNCTGVNNKAPQAVFGSTTTDTQINCILYNNKTAAGVAVGFDDKTAIGVKIFRNNAYDVAHPTITGGEGSDINIATCIANLTAEQAKIDVPTFIGAATTPEQLAELHAYAATITTKLKPKAGSVLKGAGVNNTTYPNPTDYDGTERPEESTIGILEGE